MMVADTNNCRAATTVACLLAVLLLATPGASSVGATKELTDISCGECKEIVGVVYGIAENPIALNTTIDVLIGICNSKYVNDTTKRDECVLIMKLGEGIVPLVFDGLAALAWDIPLTFCADVVGVCYEPCCDAGAPPQEIFINFADSTDLTQMRVTWITLNETEGGAAEWWHAPTGAVQVARETTRTYTAGGWLGVIHSAVMTGLAPDTEYAYRVGSNQYGWSGNLTFRTLPTVIGVPARPLRVLQLADMGCTAKADATIQLMEALVAQGKVDMIVHSGDIGYANGDEQRWDYYFNKVVSIASRVPYMTTPGNHELYMNFTAYQARLRASMPVAKSEAPSGNMYFALTVGPAEFLFLNSETFIDTGDLPRSEMEWFERHMAAVDRARTPLVTVAQHRPLYCQSCVQDFNAAVLRSQGEAAFNRWGVDLHLSGHVHNYQRLYAMRNGSIATKSYHNPGAPVYVVNGAAGNTEGQDAVNAGGFVAYGSTDYGVALLSYIADASEGTAQVKYDFYNAATQSIIDSFTLTKTV